MVVVKNVHWTVLPNKFLSEALICLLFTAQGRKRNKALFESPSDMTFYAFQGWNMTQFRIEFIRPALSKMDFQLKTWENFFLRAHFIIKWTRVLTQLGACAWTRGAQLCVKMRQLWCKKVLMTMMIAWWFWNLYSTKKGQKRSKFIWSCQQRSNSISSCRKLVTKNSSMDQNTSICIGSWDLHEITFIGTHTNTKEVSSWFNDQNYCMPEIPLKLYIIWSRPSRLFSIFTTSETF